MKPFRFLWLAALSAAPQAMWAAVPDGTAGQAGRPPVNSCAIMEDGQTLACLGGDPEVGRKARQFMEEHAAALRAKPDLTEEDRALLDEYERMLSGPRKIITIKPLPR